MAKVKGSQRTRNNLQPTNKLRSVQYSAYAAIALSAAGIFLLTWFSSGLYNSGTIFIEPEMSKFFGLDFKNDKKGVLEIEGVAYFKGNIQNLGRIDCGQCISGVSYFSSKSEEPIKIGGSGTLTSYDVILTNPHHLNLKTEWQIVNSFRFQNGILFTDRQDEDASLHFLPGAIEIEAHDDRHVDGYVWKTGKENFLFPIGDGKHLYKFGIAQLDSSRTIKAAYYSSKEKHLTNTKAIISNDSLHKDIISIYEDGYWHVNGNGQGQIQLYWDETHQFASWLPAIDQLVIAGWNRDHWEIIPVEFKKGNLEVGIISSERISFNLYDAYTFGYVGSEYVKKDISQLEVSPAFSPNYKFQLSPNPAVDTVILFIEAPGLNKLTCFVQDENESTLYKNQCEGYGKLFLEVKSWNPGIYTIKLQRNNLFFAERNIIVQEKKII